MILIGDSEGPDQIADAQADLGLCCPHIPEDTFPHGAAHIIERDIANMTQTS